MARDLLLRVGLQALDRVSRPLRSINTQAQRTGQAMRETSARLQALNATQRQVGQFRELKAGLASTRSSLEAARQRTQRLGRELAQTSNPSAELRREFDQSRRSLQQLGRQETAQSRQLQQLREGLRTAGINTRQLGEHERQLRDNIRRSNAEMEAQRRRLQDLTRQQQRLNRVREDYRRSQQLAGSMATAGAGGLAAGSGILYAGARMLSPGLDFDASMSKVQALTKQEKGSDGLNALRNQARQLGASTQFTAGQAADAQSFLAMAGFKLNAILAAMPGMLDLAKAGDTDLAQTADIASNILSGLGLQANEMGRLGDVLTATFGNSNTNLQMLGETMKYAAPIAKTYAVDLETVAAMAGKLGDAGIQGSMGGTALSAIMNRMAAPPKAAAKALDALGISTADAAGNMRPMPDLLKEIYEKTKNLGTATRGGYFKAIAGEEAVKGMSYLVEQAGSGALQSFIADLRNAEGTASAVSKVMANNLRGDLTAMGSAWEDLGIQMQEQQDGPMREIAQSLTGIIGGVKGWIAENPKLAANIVKTAAGVGILMAAMGGLTLALASILGPFAMVRLGMNLLGLRSISLLGSLFKLGRSALPLVAKGILFIGRALMLNPIGLAITSIAGGAYLIYRNWDTVGPYFKGLWAELKQGFSGGLGDMATTVLNFSPLGLFYRAFAGVMGYFGYELPAKFSDFGGMLVDGLVSGIKGALGKAKSAITGLGGSAINWFKEKLGIHSPSRVFAELGDYTMQGFAQGLTNGEAGPLQALTGIGKKLIQAGALALSTSGAIAIDNRPPLSAAVGNQSAANSASAFTFNIYPSAGMDEQALARMIAAEVDKIQHRSQVRSRSALHDQE